MTLWPPLVGSASGCSSPAGGHVPDVLVALLALLVGRHVGTIRWRVVTQEDQAAGGIGVQADPLGADRPLEVVQEEIPLDPPVELGTTGHQTPPGLTFAGSSAVM
jgi:hypothetical protein